jgi:hypothetical protein
MAKTLGIMLAAAAATLAAAPLGAARPTGEERLAKLLEGRVAGEPRGCITTPGHNNMMVLDKTAIVYRAGGKVWVNRTANPQDIDDDDILLVRRFSGSSLCRQDTITLADRQTGMFSGVLFLEDFVPYEKAGG